MIGSLCACRRVCLFKKCDVDGVIARGLPMATVEALEELGIPVVFLRGGEGASTTYINGPHSDDGMIGRIVGEEFSRLNLAYWGFVHWDGVMWQ